MLKLVTILVPFGALWLSFGSLLAHFWLTFGALWLIFGALLVDFGTEDHLIADILFGREKPGGKLPIELPRSQEAANNQKEDLPYDSENPLYNFGHGLEY